jgi:hypothetical protein
VRLVCDEDLPTRFREARARLWQALRGALGIFRDVSEEVRRLRRLHALGAGIAYAPSGVLAPDLVPLRHVLFVSDLASELSPAWSVSLRRAARVLTSSDAVHTHLIERFGLAADRVVDVPPIEDAAHLPAVLAALRQAHRAR